MPTAHEEGMTVLELMIAMLIMIVITVPLVSSFILGTRTTSEDRQEVQNSADAQILSTYFDIDVAGAESVRTTSGPTCAVSGGTPVLTLESHDAGDAVLVTYATTDASTAAKADAGLAAAAALYELQRARCVNGTADAASPMTVARQVLTTSVLCDGPTSCAAPRTVTLRAGTASRYLPDQGSPGTYTIGVTAVRKVSP